MSGIIAAAGITAAAGLGGGLLSMGKGSGGVATQTQQSTIPQGIQQRDSDNYDLAMQTAQQLKDPYGGQRVASLTPEQRDLIARMYGNVGSGNAAYDQASGMYNGLVGFNSGQITPQTMAGTNLQPYMSPYTQQIIDPAMKLMEQSRQQAIGQIAGNANQAHAFGGSRQGIAEGVTNSQSELQKGQFGADLYNKNFLNAQQMATGDITRDVAAQQSNMGARQWDAGFQGNLAGQITNNADKRQQNFLQGITAAMGGQQVLQSQQQAELDAAKKYYEEQRQQPLDVLGIRQNALSKSIYGTGSQSTAPGPSSDPWMTGLGTAATVGGLMGSFSKAGLFGDGKSTSGFSYPSPAQSSMYPELGPMGR